ncbi:PACE efflux transporter [Pseudomonas putida]|uniref:PACE efflux transporter n=1 Tax=Pseudomonas putida TaxID=303 RepID=UPI0009510CC8|nr:PACE efflux transporter [Pseudomonas putida]
MRTPSDRIRHALLFEIVGLAIFIPGSSLLFGKPLTDMGVIGIISATAATIWNFIYNYGFDRALLRLKGTTHKNIYTRVTHTLLFELGLILVLIPMIAWYLQINLIDALILDIAIVTFYLVYAFAFNIAYDRLFPIPNTLQSQRS